ncbi:hypothetical protein ACROYT_G016115 [Oculina patagonica]
MDGHVMRAELLCKNGHKVKWASSSILGNKYTANCSLSAADCYILVSEVGFKCKDLLLMQAGDCGSEYVVFTKNNPLTLIQSKSKLKEVEQRWTAELANFNFRIEYRPGRHNANADALSRISIIAAKPLEVLAMDFTQLEPASEDSRENVLVLTDVFTKFTVAIHKEMASVKDLTEPCMSCCAPHLLRRRGDGGLA